ncbi:MAG: dTMP kinase [Gammaproteobacteria bacterium]|nr:dTMP kinase [Gammaproteobacteria bacterium]
MQGKFITLEGLDGAGKSVAMEAVVSTIQEAGFEVVTTREVGGTPIGEKLRKLVLSRDSDILPNAEVLLMFAARSQHLEQLILPNIEAGRWVVCDRFTDSTYAYQGGGRELPFDRIAQIEQWTQGEFRPDLTLVFDADIKTAQQRVRQMDSPDRFEKEADAFHNRVRTAFIRLHNLHPERIKCIDATLDVDEVKDISQRYIKEFIDQTHG